MRRVPPLSGLIGALAMLVCVHDAHSAQISDFPNRPIRFIVPYPPGGGTDVVARVVARRLADELGQQIVIDNQIGRAHV